MRSRLLFCLALAGCASSSRFVGGPYVTKLRMDDSALVVERCALVYGVESNPGGAIAAAAVVSVLTVGMVNGGGDGTTHELHTEGCQVTRQDLEVAP